MEKRFLRLLLLVFVGLLAFGFAGIVAQGNRQQQADKFADPTYAHGFQVGYTLAKSGMTRPTDAELDAHARSAAVALKDKGGLGFKTQWKSAFDTGWRAAD